MEELLLATNTTLARETNTAVIIQCDHSETPDEGELLDEDNELKEYLRENQEELKETFTLAYRRLDDTSKILLPKSHIPLETCAIFWDRVKKLGIRANEKLYEGNTLSFVIDDSERGLAEEKGVASWNQFNDVQNPGKVIKPDKPYSDWRKHIIREIQANEEKNVPLENEKYGKYLFNEARGREEANCEFAMIDGDENHIHFTLIKDVEPGEEIIVNYGWDKDEDFAPLLNEPANKKQKIDPYETDTDEDNDPYATQTDEDNAIDPYATQTDEDMAQLLNITLMF